MSEDESPENTPAEEVMILFMGTSHQHALTSIQHFNPEAVHIVTSDKFRKSYVRRLNDWSKKYNFRKGSVQSVTDLFEPSCVDSLLDCVLTIFKLECDKFERNVDTFLWSVGITGGTMLMASVATIAAGILDAHAFYVIKPKDGQAIMPNRDIISLPGLRAFKIAMLLKPSDIMDMLKSGGGQIEELIESTAVEPWMLGDLTRSKLIEIHSSEPKWRMTNSGIQIFGLMASGPQYRMRMRDELKDLKKNQEPSDEYNYHG